MNLILFGFKGSGKTHLGKQLSAILNCPFVDTDQLISELYSQTPREIYRTLGEAAFRKLESEAISTLQPTLNGIISVGGGAVLDPRNVDRLQCLGKCVYLRAHFETIKVRLMEQELPLFVNQADPIASLHRIFHNRLPIYEAIPATTIDVDQVDEATCLSTLESLARNTLYGL